ncbi:hypothetical protein [Catenuloplanes atrovinosus]|uniref:DUF4034 domain-containing protein n=1 Tax=Catenuloplanes atrovinosus TaxID=137266 RepID=A0AAE4CDH8_9ACTN|nr:hypothetical protein [Catenuloplanes atrovinosus]MDR7280631.1 hypothetical protein [Catenuloplanes atrovinosus]
MLPPLSAPDFDAATAYPEVAVLRTALGAGDWPAVRRLWDSLDWAGRSELAGAVGDISRPAEVEHLVGVLEAASRDDPADPAAGAMLGAHLVAAGWRIRSGYQARYVSADQFTRFHEHLRRADEVLAEATARNPGNVTAWQYRVTIARGLQTGLAEARRRYDRAVRTDPHHVRTELSYQQMICPKWDGSWELLHEFSRERMLAAPEGAHNAVLVPLGHLEHWLELDDKKDAAYLRSKAVRDEIYEAAHRSVWHPAFQRTVGWVHVMNVFAGLFSLLDDHRAALSQFAALGPLATGSPWNYIGGDEGPTFMWRRNMAIMGAK